MEGHSRLQELPPDSLRRLHRRVIDDPQELRRLLLRLQREGVVLTAGLSRGGVQQTARIQRVAGDGMYLETSGIGARALPQIFLRFRLDDVEHFFAVPPMGGGGREPLLVALPSAIYEAERRDLRRSAQRGLSSAVRLYNRGEHEGYVADQSYQGLAVLVPEVAVKDVALGDAVPLHLMDGERGGQEVFGVLRYRRSELRRPGWVRIGLSVSSVPSAPPIPIQRRHWDREESTGWRRRSLPSVGRKRETKKKEGKLPDVEIVDYPNGAGGMLRGIVSRTGDARRAPVVVLPPAWGKTKETLLALAETLIASFRAAGEPLVVVRFDGTNRRGESYVEPANRSSGLECLGFRFSQAVTDIRATLDFLEASPDFASDRFVLVTYSLSAVEGRRATALDSRIVGWVSVVGMPDLQSGLRAVSGGVDYAYGATQGVTFGLQELVGVVADMDATGRDALEHSLVFAEDARRDMARIKVPVTWIHGQHDAWMDLGRVRELLSAGDTSKRKLLAIPIGHRMRVSREALYAFQVVAGEIAEILLGRPIETATPDRMILQNAGLAEAQRLPSEQIDLPAFWRDYLLGRSREVGIELMTATTAYRSLMDMQVTLLGLGGGDVVADLGAGTGDGALGIAELPGESSRVTVIEVDYIREALSRGRLRAQGWQSLRESGPQFRFVCANLDHGSRGGIPLARESVDAVLASLLISYVSDEEALLSDVHDILRPGGRLVLSSLKRDADISRIYEAGIAELVPDRVRARFGDRAAAAFDSLQRAFLNDAAKLMDLEETGHFRFWDAADLVDLIAGAGFSEVSVTVGFGDPPQAIVVAAKRP